MAANDHKYLEEIASNLAVMIMRAKDKADRFPEMAAQLWTLHGDVKALLCPEGDFGFNPNMIVEAEAKLRTIIQIKIDDREMPDQVAKKMRRRRAAWFSWQCLLALSVGHALQEKLVESREVNARNQRASLVVNRIVDCLVPKVGAKAFLLYHWLASEGTLLTNVTNLNRDNKEVISQMTAARVCGLFDTPAQALSPPTGTPFTLFPPQIVINVVPAHSTCKNSQQWFETICTRLWMPNVGKCTYDGAQDETQRCAFTIDGILKLIGRNAAGAQAAVPPVLPLAFDDTPENVSSAPGTPYHVGAATAGVYGRSAPGIGGPTAGTIAEGGHVTERQPHRTTTSEAAGGTDRPAAADSAASGLTPYRALYTLSSTVPRDGRT